MARPRIEINRAEFEKLCGLQCTLTEIAYWFGCSPDTIERWAKREYVETDENGKEKELGFAEVYIKYSAAGKMSLRRDQFALAKKSAAMAIWLGKQYLGQRDVQVFELENSAKMVEEVEGLVFGDVPN